MLYIDVQVFFSQIGTLNVSVEESHAAKKRPASPYPQEKIAFLREPQVEYREKNFSIVIFAIQEMRPAVHGSQQAKAQWAGYYNINDEDGQCELCLCQTFTYNAKISRVWRSHSLAPAYH